MDRIGIVQLRELVATAAGKRDLPLKLVGDPIPPARLYCGDLPLGTGTPTQVAAVLEMFVLGYDMCQTKVAAQCLAQALTNEPPHVVVKVKDETGHYLEDIGDIVFSDMPGLVVVVFDPNADYGGGDEKGVSK